MMTLLCTNHDCVCVQLGALLVAGSTGRVIGTLQSYPGSADGQTQDAESDAPTGQNKATYSFGTIADRIKRL